MNCFTYATNYILSAPVLLSIPADPFQSLQKKELQSVNPLSVNSLGFSLRKLTVYMCAIIILYKVFVLILRPTGENKAETKNIVIHKLVIVILSSSIVVFLDFLFKIFNALLGL